MRKFDEVRIYLESIGFKSVSQPVGDWIIWLSDGDIGHVYKISDMSMKVVWRFDDDYPSYTTSRDSKRYKIISEDEALAMMI